MTENLSTQICLTHTRDCQRKTRWLAGMRVLFRLVALSFPGMAPSSPPPPADHDATADDPHLPFGTRLVRFVGALMAAAPPNAPYVFLAAAWALLQQPVCRPQDSPSPVDGTRPISLDVHSHAATPFLLPGSSLPCGSASFRLLSLCSFTNCVSRPPPRPPRLRAHHPVPPRPSPPGLKLACFRQTAPLPRVWPRQYTRLRTWRPPPVGWPSRRPPAGSSSPPPAPR